MVVKKTRVWTETNVGCYKMLGWQFDVAILELGFDGKKWLQFWPVVNLSEEAKVLSQYESWPLALSHASKYFTRNLGG